MTGETLITLPSGFTLEGANLFMGELNRFFGEQFPPEKGVPERVLTLELVSGELKVSVFNPARTPDFTRARIIFLASGFLAGWLAAGGME